MFKLSYRQMMVHKGRTILTILSVALSVALFFSIQIISESISRSVDKEVSDTFGESDVQLTMPTYTKNVFPADLLTEIAGMSEVESYTAFSQGLMLVEANGEESRLLVSGTPKGLHEQGKASQLSDEQLHAKSEVIVHEKYADKQALSIGDELILHIEGKAELLTVASTMSPEDSEQLFNGASIIVQDDLLRDLLQIEDGYHFISVTLKDKQKVHAFISEVKQVVPEEAIIIDQTILAENIRSSFNDLQSGFIFFICMSVFLGVFIIYHTFHIIVNQRIKIIGTLRALGANKLMINRLFLTESCILGMIGASLGSLLGCGLAYGLMDYFTSSLGLSEVVFHIPMLALVFAIILGIAISLIAAFIPAIIAGRKQPIDALSSAHFHIENPHKKTPYLSFVGGIIILFIGLMIWRSLNEVTSQLYLILALFIILFGILWIIPMLLHIVLKIVEQIFQSLLGLQGKLAVLTLSRAKERTKNALTLVIMTFTIVLGIVTISHSVENGWVNEYDDSFAFDLSIRPTDDLIYLEKDTGEILESIDGTALAVPYYLFFEESKEVDHLIAVYGAPLASYLSLKKMTIPDGYAKANDKRLYSGEGLAISENIASQLEKDIGDTYELEVGGKTRELEIAAIYKEMNAGGYSIMIPEKVMVELYDPYGPSGYFVTLNKEVESEADWLQSLSATSLDGKIEVTTLEAELMQLRSLIKQLFIPFQAINVIIVIIALLGIANSLLISMMERKREFALLRSLGANKSQLQHLISLEGILISLVGLAIGIPQGLLIGYLITYWWRHAIESNISFQLPLSWIIIGSISSILLIWMISIITARTTYTSDISKSI